MTTKHTPGPWIAKQFDESQAAILPNPHNPAHPLIAIISTGEGRPNGAANAQLIAAAPDLAEALQACLQIIQDEANTRPAPEWDNLYRITRQALQRAGLVS